MNRLTGLQDVLVQTFNEAFSSTSTGSNCGAIGSGLNTEPCGTPWLIDAHGGVLYKR